MDMTDLYRRAHEYTDQCFKHRKLIQCDCDRIASDVYTSKNARKRTARRSVAPNTHFAKHRITDRSFGSLSPVIRNVKPAP